MHGQQNIKICTQFNLWIMAFIISMTQPVLYPATHSLSKLRTGSNKHTGGGGGPPPPVDTLNQPTQHKENENAIASLGKATNELQPIFIM